MGLLSSGLHPRACTKRHCLRSLSFLSFLTEREPLTGFGMEQRQKPLLPTNTSGTVDWKERAGVAE
jgi:hypothetical protein